MTYIYTPFVWPFVATVIMNLLMIVYVLKNPDRKGVVAFSLTMVFCSLWCVETVMVYSATSLEIKNFWAKAGFPTHSFGALAWLIMILQMTDQPYWANRKRVVVLSIIPTITMLLAWTNDLHGLVWQQAAINSDGTFTRIWGWWFWVHSVYSDGMSFFSVFLAAWFWRSKAPLYGRQFGCLTFSVLFVMVVNALYILGIWRGIDPTTVAWGIASLFVTRALFRNKLFDLVPIARNRIMESVADGIVVLDGENRIVDMNPAAQVIFDCNVAENIGRYAVEFFEQQPVLQELIIAEGTYAEFQSMRFQQERYYEIFCSPLKNERGIFLGKLLNIRDITGKKLAEQELLQKQQEIARQEERERMARDLHDNLGQILGFVNVQARAIREYLSQDQLDIAVRCLDRLTEVAQEAHKTVRKTILSMQGDMIPQVAGAADFFQAVDRQVNLFVQGFGLAAEIDYAGAQNFVLHDSRMYGQILNILKEAMNNIVKHSQARSMKIVFREKDNTLRLSVTDNGCGFDTKFAGLAYANRYGLLFMKERAAELGGCCQIRSTVGQGTTVLLQIPTQPKRAIRQEFSALL
ncbi:MAG: histidine kinase N-terminal 7TM domain-containing protein [Veillonellales bacterium]